MLPKLLALLPALLPTVRTVLATSTAAATSATSFAFSTRSLEVTPSTRSTSPAHANALLQKGFRAVVPVPGRGSGITPPVAPSAPYPPNTLRHQVRPNAPSEQVLGNE